MLKLQIWAQSVSPRIFTVATPIYQPGGPPPTPPSDAYLAQIGRYQVTMSAGGSGTLTLQQPFPNGWLSLQMNGLYNFQYNTGGVTLQAITVTYGLAAGTVYIDVLAVGW
jgi:hypothetical protein